MIHEEKHTVAILIKSNGRRRRDAQRQGVEILYLLLALCSLATGSLWKAVNIQNAPEEVRGNINRFRISDAHKIYAERFETASWAVSAMSKDTKALVRRLIAQYQAFDENQKKKFRDALFAHYGALGVSNENRALAIVGFLAALGALSKHLQKTCPGQVNCSKCGKIHPHNAVGDRMAITKNIQDRASRAFTLSAENLDVLDKWVRRLYNKHRSQFVHSAQHRFNEYNQRTERGKASGCPSAAPTDTRIVSELNEFTSDFDKLPIISRFMLLDQFELCFGGPIPYAQICLDIPDFTERYTQEAFVGFPTSGWTQL